jgi:hypothetical protein
MITLLTYMVTTVAIIGTILLGYLVFKIYTTDNAFRSDD